MIAMAALSDAVIEPEKMRVLFIAYYQHNDCSDLAKLTAVRMDTATGPRNDFIGGQGDPAGLP
ncbi:MAG: hypothetical protein ABR988_09140 [Terriglobales bacterium]|jgi:hypothetical protein